jgi:hypothetical protein
MINGMGEAILLTHRLQSFAYTKIIHGRKKFGCVRVCLSFPLFIEDWFCIYMLSNCLRIRSLDTRTSSYIRSAPRLNSMASLFPSMHK